jgi:hypothetical protein
METQNYKPVGQGPSDEMDPLLDAALKQYAAVQPRAGLEERVLAHVRNQDGKVPRHAWWHWGFAAAVIAALALIIAIAWGPWPEPERDLTQHRSLSVPGGLDNHPQLNVGRASAQRVATKPPKHRSYRAAVVQVAEAAPKLDQFPSPQPLSQEELVLARYALEFPAEATLIAKAQDEYEREVQREMRSTDSGIRPSGLDK